MDTSRCKTCIWYKLDTGTGTDTVTLDIDNDLRIFASSFHDTLRSLTVAGTMPILTWSLPSTLGVLFRLHLGFAPDPSFYGGIEIVKSCPYFWNKDRSTVLLVSEENCNNRRGVLPWRSSNKSWNYFTRFMAHGSARLYYKKKESLISYQNIVYSRIKD